MKIFSGMCLVLAFLATGTLEAATLQNVGASWIGVEAEDYDSLSGTRYIVVDTTPTFTSAYGSDVLPATTNAFGGAALLHNFTGSGGVAQYDFVFRTAGTYYAYVHYSMFENNSNTANYGNEDSFFSSTDWDIVPAGDNLHTVDFDYSGFGSHSDWEGAFRWNQSITRDSGGAFRQIKVALVVNPGDLGSTLSYYITPRESGATIDYILLSTSDNLTPAQLYALVPEPATFSVMGLGMLGLAARRR